MIWHPLLLAVLGMDALSFLLVVAAAFTAMRIVLEWAPHSASREQIQLEIRAETAAIQTKYGLVVFLLATLALIIGITNVFPGIVPGAMCGTGVLQATQGLGSRALALRLGALAVLYCWRVLETLNRLRPDAPLTLITARTLLVASPILFLASTDTFRAILAPDLHQPVECCAVVYDQFRSLAEAKSTAGLPDVFWIWAFMLGSLWLLLCGLRVWRSRSLSDVRKAVMLAFITLLWIPVAAVSLVRILAAYHYEVLHHHCPWCLFLPEHHMVGFPLFGALVFVALETAAAGVAAAVAQTFPGLQAPAIRRFRQGGRRLVLATFLFLLLAGLPALIWRVGFGVWMG